MQLTAVELTQLWQEVPALYGRGESSSLDSERNRGDDSCLYTDCSRSRDSQTCWDGKVKEVGDGRTQLTGAFQAVENSA